MFTAETPAVLRFLKAWHENGRASFEKRYPALNYDQQQGKRAIDRRRFVALDCGTSGAFLLNKSTGELYSIKGYGRPNRLIGMIDSLTEALESATAAGRPMPQPGYVDSDSQLRKEASLRISQ